MLVLEKFQMKDDEKQKIAEMAKRFGVPQEFIELSISTRQATTMRDKLKALDKERTLIEQGATESIEKQHEKGCLTARERLNKLLDEDSFEELDSLQRPYDTGLIIGEEAGKGDGVVVGYGTVQDRPVTVWAQDATVLGGSVGTVHARKVTMIQENALNARTPIIAILDSAGLRAQDAIQYPDFYSPSSMSYFQTLASGVVPKISLVMGQCTGEVAIVAALGDFIFMVRNSSYMHLMPSPDGISGQELGDPWNVHAKITGCCDVLAENEEDCLLKCRQLLSYLPRNNSEEPPLLNTGDDPNRREEELLEIVPINSSKPFSMYRIISLVVDNGESFEIKRHFASNLITCFARLGGHTVGIIANNPQDRGGCMTLDAADKMTHFVRFCDAFNIPLIWLVDCPAFLPAIEEERRGLIRHGGAMIMANTEATVPKITVILRKIYGGASLAMCARILPSDLAVAWPGLELGVMGAEGAVSILYRRELADIQDEEIREEQKKKRIEEMQWSLDMITRGGAQRFIDPRETRAFLIRSLKWLKNKRQDLPPRKHENIRM
jgi:acetyl-CoA carboxylase carboxyltransferase component